MTHIIFFAGSALWVFAALLAPTWGYAAACLAVSIASLIAGYRIRSGSAMNGESSE